jgi:hypothetical protein
VASCAQQLGKLSHDMAIDVAALFATPEGQALRDCATELERLQTELNRVALRLATFAAGPSEQKAVSP